MRYTKEEKNKRYEQIYYMKVVKRLSNAQITALMPHCKERTIQYAMQSVNEQSYTNSALVQMAIDGYNDDIARLYEMRESLFADFGAIDTTDTYKQAKRTSTARIINEITGQIAAIRTMIVRLQGLFEKEVHKQKSIFDYPKIEMNTQTVVMVKNADGSSRMLPATDDILALAEENMNRAD